MDDKTLEKARGIFQRAWQNAVGASTAESKKIGVTVADVLRVFPGARVISKTAPAEKPQQQQLKLIQGGKR